MIKFFYIVQMVSAVITVFLVLLHSPKGDGLASIGAASQLFASQKSTEKNLNKLTYFFVVLFIVSSFLLGYLIKQP